MNSRSFILGAGFTVLVGVGTARAQTVVPPALPPSTPDAPSTTTPNAITPPNGVARGVIRPNRPVDSKMVTKPPVTSNQPMPVIKPPGTAR